MNTTQVLKQVRSALALNNEGGCIRAFNDKRSADCRIKLTFRCNKALTIAVKVLCTLGVNWTLQSDGCVIFQASLANEVLTAE